jgi:hypothetical protein
VLAQLSREGQVGGPVVDGGHQTNKKQQRMSAAAEEEHHRHSLHLPHLSLVHPHHHHHQEEEEETAARGSFDDDLHHFHDAPDDAPPPAVVIPASMVIPVFSSMAVAEGYLERAVHTAFTLYRLAEFESSKVPQYHLGAVTRMMIGVGLCFFGGQFSTFVAFLEAFVQGGGKTMFANLRTLHDSIHPVQVRDQGSHVRTAMKVADPILVQQSVLGLYTASMSALVAVKLANGRLFALGGAIGEHIDRPVQKYIVPSLLAHASPEAAAWIPMASHYTSRALGVLVSAPVQKHLGVIATAVRGGHMIMDNLDELLLARGVELNFSQVLLDDVLVGSIIALGVAFQFAAKLPGMVMLLLAPALIVEYLLTSAIQMV